jgi:terminase small subunit / prophage DNA-packing protein
VATLHEVAAHLGVTIKYVQDLIANGTLEKRGRGEYDLDACREAYITRLREAAAGRANSGDLNLTEERARLAKEQADAKEMENSITRGELVYIDDVAKRVEVALSKVKTKILAIPTKVAPEAAAADDAKEVQALIERHIIEALNELAGIDAASAG